MALRSETHQKENQLWRSLQAGDELAFESLYRIHANALLAYGLKITNQQEIANKKTTHTDPNTLRTLSLACTPLAILSR